MVKDVNYWGSKSKIKLMEKNEFKELVRTGDIVNCTYNNVKYKSEYTIETKEDNIKYVVEKTKEFKNKMSLLGLDCEIECLTIGEDIILTDIKYNNGDKVMIPNFVTSVAGEAIKAFSNSIIMGNKVEALGNGAIVMGNRNEIKLNKSLRYLYRKSINAYDIDVKDSYKIDSTAFNYHNALLVN